MSATTPLPDDDLDVCLSQYARSNSPRAQLTFWLLGVMFTAAFFVLIHLANLDADHASRMAAINADLDAADERLQRAARALCLSEAGPGAQALWTQDGDLVCRPALITAEVTP